MRLPLAHDPGPVRSRGGKHDAVVGIDPHRRRPPTSKILGILSPFLTKRRGPEDDEILRRTIVMARDCKTAFVGLVGNRCAVAFVSDQGVLTAESIAIAQPGALKRPVVGVLHGVADRFPLTPPLTAAVAMANAGQAVFRINSKPLVPLLIIAGQLALVADKSSIALDQVDPPPAGVSTEKGDVSTPFHESLDVAPHRFAPIFVVTGADEEPVGFEEITEILVYIEIGTIIDCEACSFE